MCGFLQFFGVCVIPNKLLCMSSLPVSKHQRTPFQFHYSLLSTAHSVPTNGSNNKTVNVLVTLRSVRATNVIVESSKFCVLSLCVYRLKYPACNSHGPYCHSLSARYKIFSKLFLSGTILEIKLLRELYILISSGNLVQIISHCKTK